MSDFFDDIEDTSSDTGAGAPTTLEKFAEKVLHKIMEDNVPPIPYYYNIYFQNLLDEESPEFRKSTLEFIDMEESNSAEESIAVEKKLKQSHRLTKELLQYIAMIYKIANTLNSVLEKKAKESNNIASQQALNSLIKSMSKDLSITSQKISKFLENVKELYAKNVSVLKEIEGNSFFDSKFGIYNKNYFIKELKKELNLIKKFKHNSSLLVLKINDEVSKKFKSEKSLILANRTVAKIILKTSRRTDIVAHIGNNIFAMLLKHTDRIGASKTAERLSDTISNSSVFLEGDEITLKISIGIIEIMEDKDYDISDYLTQAIDAMLNAEKEQTLYKIAEGE